MRLPWLAFWFASINAAAAADWREDLSAQLAWAHDCEVAFLTGVVEREVEGAMTVIAKAHCSDGRVFDALRRDPFEDFELNACASAEQTC